MTHNSYATVPYGLSICRVHYNTTFISIRADELIWYYASIDFRVPIDSNQKTGVVSKLLVSILNYSLDI